METLYYIFIFLLSLFLCHFFDARSKIRSKILVAIILSFFLAIRDVPGDNSQYQDAYLGLIYREYEYGWSCLILFFQKLGASLVVYKWFAIYFLQILFFLLSVKKEWNYMLPLIMFFYFCMGGIEQASNIMRQWLAACIGLYSFSVYLSKMGKYQKWSIFILCIFLASLFHKSAVLLLLTPIILKLPYINRNLQVFIFIFTFFLSDLFVDLWVFMSSILNTEDFVYNWYFNEYELKKLNCHLELDNYGFYWKPLLLPGFQKSCFYIITPRYYSNYINCTL